MGIGIRKKLGILFILTITAVIVGYILNIFVFNKSSKPVDYYGISSDKPAKGDDAVISPGKEPVKPVPALDKPVQETAAEAKGVPKKPGERVIANRQNILKNITVKSNQPIPAGLPDSVKSTLSTVNEINNINKFNREAEKRTGK